MDLRVVVEGAGTYRGKKTTLTIRKMDTVQIVGWKRWKNWIRRRSGKRMVLRGRGRRREGVRRRQKWILQLLVDLGELSQLETNTHTQLSGHEPGTTGKSGVTDNYKVELALPQLSTALNWLTSTLNWTHYTVKNPCSPGEKHPHTP